MGRFRDNARDFGGRGGRSGGFSRGGRGGFRDRSSGGFDRGRPERYEVTCDKCGERCEVPFKPTGEKPVYCDSCFKSEGSSRKAVSGGISPEQFEQLNAKLDKILEILSNIEFEEEADDGEEDYEDESDEDEVEEVK